MDKKIDIKKNCEYFLYMRFTFIKFNKFDNFVSKYAIKNKFLDFYIIIYLVDH